MVAPRPSPSTAMSTASTDSGVVSSIWLSSATPITTATMPATR